MALPLRLLDGRSSILTSAEMGSYDQNTSVLPLPYNINASRLFLTGDSGSTTMADPEVANHAMSDHESSGKDLLSTSTRVQEPYRWATKEDWIRHRALIEELYGDRRLTEVAKIMESIHGFKATPSMYKKHLKVWGVTKYHNECEMRAMLHANSERIRQRKPVIFRLRGRVVKHQDVVRYWERKGKSLEDVVDQQSTSLTIQPFEMITPVHTSLKTPKVLAIPERILIKVRDYCAASFDSGNWISRGEESDCVTKVMGNQWNRASHDKFSYYCATAITLFEDDHYNEAGQTLVAASASIRDILFMEHPDTLRIVFHAVMSFSLYHKEEIALIILRHFSALGSLSLGCEHPLPRICGWLASMKGVQTSGFLAICFQTLANSFESVVGPMQLTLWVPG